MDQARIHFDLTPAQNADAAGFADACLVVAINIGAHGEFRLFLGRIQQCADIFGILNRITATCDGAGDRAGFDTLSLDPDIHFRRCADQVFTVAEIDQEAVRGGVATLETAENFRWFDITGGAENAAGHDFKQFATGKAVLRILNNGGIFALFHIVFDGGVVAA